MAQGMGRVGLGQFRPGCGHPNRLLHRFQVQMVTADEVPFEDPSVLGALAFPDDHLQPFG
jgi:hypothetical protein